MLFRCETSALRLYWWPKYMLIDASVANSQELYGIRPRIGYHKARLTNPRHRLWTWNQYVPRSNRNSIGFLIIIIISVTADFAQLAPQGKVIGIDAEEDVLAKARQITSERGITNVEFTMGDIHALNYPDNTFDLVHVHQVLQHIKDPIKALQEMRRVTKPGGYVAAREGEVGTMTWYPDPDDTLVKYKAVYVGVSRSINAEPHAGRKLLSWAQKVGFAEIKPSSSTWCYSTPKERKWWSGIMEERVKKTSFRKNALGSGLATEAELDKYSEAWHTWGDQEDGWFSMIHGEIICRV